MINKAIKKTKLIAKNVLFITQCYLLFFKNALLFRSLRVKSVSLSDCIVIENNDVDLIWNVSGCYKIKIAGIGNLRGGIHGVSCRITDVSKPIEIFFYGIFKKHREVIITNGAKVNLLNKFYSESKIPNIIEAAFTNHQLTTEYSIAKLKTNFENMHIEFDTFDPNNN